MTLPDIPFDIPTSPEPPPLEHSRHLLATDTVDDYRRTVIRGIEYVADHLAAVDRPTTGATPGDLEPVIAGIDLDRPIRDLTQALDELHRIYLRDAVYFHHPRYLGHLNCPITIPALLGEAILSSVNSSLDTWDQSAGATLIERRLVDWTAQRVGLGCRADGVFTSGGTQSNLQALLIARNEARHRLGEGAATADRLRIFASTASHFSIVKAAALLGLDESAVVAVPCDADRRMRSVALAAELDACRAAGLVPMAVVATAGTTDYGSIDPLPEIAEICAAAQVWLHVDAAYGCGLLVSRRRELLRGVERADSVTVDYHKSFFQPVSSSAVLVRDRATLRHVTHHADYLNPAESAANSIPNQVDKSLQTTRRFDALKLWLTLRIVGAEGIGEMFDGVVDLAERTWQLLAADPRFEVVTRPQLSTLVFRYVAAGVSASRCDELNQHIRNALFASGEAVIAGTRVGDRQYLKFTLLNPRTTPDEIADVLDRIADVAEVFLTDTDERQAS
ncbi:MAG: pyridoxal-dependent decarboxylase [Streptosporangiales bacterium]|nr:pyridoxal-dependent decarboxylase [Streptosporangiales bacterium]